MTRAQDILRLLVRPFEAFFRIQAAGGIILMFATVLALAWANSPWATAYHSLWQAEVTIGASDFGLSKPLVLWINDLLLAIFFLLAGLEIKRELIVGELNSFRKAALPVVAAIGGMVVPAAIFILLAPDPPASRGWGIPMTADIAFALGCLRLLGNRIPSGLIIFLTALAIIDDLGAILVVALFYATDVASGPMLLAGLFVGLLIAMRGSARVSPSPNPLLNFDSEEN